MNNELILFLIFLKTSIDIHVVPLLLYTGVSERLDARSPNIALAYFEVLFRNLEMRIKLLRIKLML